MEILIDLIYAISISFCLFTAILIFFKINKNKRIAANLLAFYFLLNGILSAFYLFIQYGLIVDFAFLYKVPAPFNFLIPPLAYFYIKFSLNEKNNFKLLDTIHLLPFIFVLLNYLPFYLIPLNEKQTLVESVVNDFSLSYEHQDGLIPESFVIILRTISYFAYIFAQWRLLTNYFRKSSNNFSYKKSKKWLLLFFRLQLLYWVGLAIIYLFFWIGIAFEPGAISHLSTVVFIFVSLIFLYLSSVLLQNPSVLLGLNSIKKVVNTDELKIDLMTQKLESIILSGEYFLDSKITLSQLSNLTNYSIENIRNIVMHLGYSNFNEFINSFRIKLAVTKMKSVDIENYSIETIALDCGFNSRTTFYRSFKKLMNCTPTEYLNNQ